MSLRIVYYIYTFSFWIVVCEFQTSLLLLSRVFLVYIYLALYIISSRCVFLFLLSTSFSICPDFISLLTCRYILPWVRLLLRCLFIGASSLMYMYVYGVPFWRCRIFHIQFFLWNSEALVLVGGRLARCSGSYGDV